MAVRGSELIGHVALNDTTSRPVMQLVEARRPEMRGWDEIGRVNFDLVGDEIEELVFSGPPA